jgi:hypothetical protein
MKPLFIITEEEKNRILGLHKDASERHYLSEQTIFRFQSPEAIKLYTLFNTKFLPSVIPNYFNMTPPEAIEAIKKLTDEQLNGVIKFFTENGYKQPNNPDIIKFQQELMKNTNISTFTNIEGSTTKFDDGTFGIATSKAVLRLRIDNLMKLPKDKTLEQIDTMNKTTPSSREAIQAPKIKTGTDVKVKTGTQPIQ